MTQTPIRTQWNAAFYTPPALRSKDPKVFHASEIHFKRGEIYAHVYVCVLAGVETVAELCHRTQRCDQRVYDALTCLEAAWYVARTVRKTGKGRQTTWRSIK